MKRILSAVRFTWTAMKKNFVEGDIKLLISPIVFPWILVRGDK